jgi:hypothetical protein
MKAFVVVCACLLLSCFSSAGTISLTADTSPPDPNDEITVWVHTDEPLLFMELDAYVTGDAKITSAMSEADCNEFGWENDWGFEPIIDDPNGWVSIGGVCWAADANDIVGYFKFRYHSGQVAIYIDHENSMAGNWGSNFTFSAEVLQFGQIKLPPLQEPNEPTPVLMQCPLGSGGPLRGESDSFDGWPEELSRGMDELDSEPSIIEINSDITTNQVWDANNVYYITDANGVDVQALLVIEPGTTVIFGNGCGLFVNNGGTLISKGTPDKPIIFTPDWVYYDYPDNIGYYWQVLYYYGPQYFCPIYIESTASPATTITYSMIEGAVSGIVTENIRLVEPIENNYLFGNSLGIFEFGPKLTDIRNNLCFYNDEAGIEAYLSPDPNDVPDTENPFTIEQNTCDGSQYAFCGITLHGVEDANEAPTVYLLNNVVSSSYWYGLNLVDGYMQMVVVNTGYYENGQNKNWEFDEYNPIIAEELPYVPEFGEKPYQNHYLVDGSAFIDAGSQYIEQTQLIGTTTNFDGLPDKDIVDLGFHHMDWDYTGSEEIAGTDIDDLIEISDYWLCHGPYDPNSPTYDPNIFDPNSPSYISDPNLITFGGDWNGDRYVDLADFAMIAQTWNAAPVVPDLVPVINGDPNNGFVAISVSGYNEDTQSIFVFIDGMYAGRVYEGTEAPIAVDLSESGNRPQQLKFMAIDGGGHFAYSDTTEIHYTSPLSYCILPRTYEPNEPILFAAYNTEPNAISSVSVYANGGQLVWSQVFDGNSICGSIPAAVVSGHGIDYVQFESNNGAYTAKRTAQNEPENRPAKPSVMAILVRPDWWINWHDYKTANAVKTAFEKRGIEYVELKESSATYANVAKYAPQLKYLYIDSHGFSAVVDTNSILRTGVVLYDGDVVSAKASDFLCTPPAWCKDPLPGRKEQILKSFITMGFTDLRFFYNDSCLGAHLTIDSGTGLLMWGGSGEQSLFDFVHNDMSVACGLADTSQSRFYRGWFNESESGFPWAWWIPGADEETAYQKFSRNEWEALGDGEELYWALSEAIWKQDHFGPDDPVQNFRIKGQGDMQNFRIRSNP